MRTETGTVEKILPNHMALIQASRTSLFSRHASSIGNTTAPIEVDNTFGAKEGDFVEFAMPDQGMAIGGLIGFGLPMVIVLICAMGFYGQHAALGLSEAAAAGIGFVVGLLLALVAFKAVHKVWKRQRTTARIIRIIQ